VAAGHVASPAASVRSTDVAGTGNVGNFCIPLSVPTSVLPIPVVISNWRLPARRVSSRPRCLLTVKLVDNVIKHEDELSSLYLINPTSLAKNNAKQLLAIDATST